MDDRSTADSNVLQLAELAAIPTPNHGRSDAPIGGLAATDVMRRDRVTGCAIAWIEPVSGMHVHAPRASFSA
jgi:hypothetical protein